MNLDFVITMSTVVCGEDVMVVIRKRARLIDDT